MSFGIVSFGIACAKYPNVAKAELVKGVFTYLASAKGQGGSSRGLGTAQRGPCAPRSAPAVEAISGR